MRSPLSYLTFWFVPLLVRFNVYLGATKGLFDASVVLLLVTACTSSAIAMIWGISPISGSVKDSDGPCSRGR